MKTKVWLLLFSLIFLSNFLSQGNSVDTTKLEIRRFDTEELNKLRSQRDFNYSENKANSVSLWDKILWFIIDKIFRVIGLYWVQYPLIILVVGLIIFLILRSSNQMIFVGNSLASKVVTIDFEDVNKDINFDELINQSITNGDFRTATRYLYLKTLKFLHKNGEIIYEKNKTNTDYAQELKGFERTIKFREISNFYEYVFYGEFQINSLQFENAKTDFDFFQRNTK